MPSINGFPTNINTRYLQYKKNAYRFNGRNLIRAVDGETFTMAGIRRLRFLPLVTVGASGQLSGLYWYYLVPTNEKKIVMNANGRARPTQGIPSFRSARVNPVAQVVGISSIPTHPDPQVTHWYIYRNRNGSIDENLEDDTQDYFFVGKVANGTTTFTDNVSDTDMLGADQILFNLNIPPAFESADIFSERMIGGGFTAFTATATKSNLTVTTKAKAAGVVTITTSGAHSLSANTWVNVDVGDSRFDGACYILSIPTSTTFTYALPGSDVSSVASSGVVQFITFSAGQHDGIIGCWLKPNGESNAYRIVGEKQLSGSIPNGTSITAVALDRQVTGTLSSTTVTIYRNPWDVYISEFQNFENWGPDGETSRWQREVPGQEGVTAIKSFGGRCLVFTMDNIYAIDANGPGIAGITMSREPLFRGVGCVGPRAVTMADDELVWCSKRGPYKLTQGFQLTPIGRELNTDWLDSLTDAERRLIVASTDSQKVWIDYPVSGATQNTETWTFDRKNGGWWAERGRYVTDAFKDKGISYYLQGAYIMRGNVGTYDQSSTAFSGTATGAGATSLTDSGAAFTTSGSGLEECEVYLFDANKVYQGHRRITSNTGTVLTLATGSPTPQVGWLYRIGRPIWRIQTRTLEAGGTKAQRVMRLETKIDLFSENPSGTLRRTDIKNGTVDSALQELTTNEPVKYFDVNSRNLDYAVRLESVDAVRIRHMILKDANQESKK